MEALIFNSYGGRVPDVVMKRMIKGLEFPQSRFDQSIINYIKTNAIEYNTEVHNDKWFEKHRDAIVRVDYGSEGMCKYLGFSTDDNGKYGIIAGVSIKDIDISRRWTMEEYDGAEIIKYLDDYECRFVDVNYWVRKERN